MPELPEVETTCRGIAPVVDGATVNTVVVRDRRLRWPVDARIASKLTGATVNSVHRRAKYVVLETSRTDVLIHLGMSGRLRVLEAPVPVPAKHDHVDIVFESGALLRLTDPRRFGSVLLAPHGADQHERIRDLGPEPLGDEFDGDYLYQRSRGRKSAVKQFIMDSHVVVGVGNIYANEALYLAGIRPDRAAGRVSRERYRALADAIGTTLNNAIAAGGTTLRDYVGSDGSPGYFKQSLFVYGREDQPCLQCGTELRLIRQNNRSTVFCGRCQR